MSKRLIEDRPYMEGDILIFIAGVMLFFASIVVFWPYVTAEAYSTYKEPYSLWFYEREIAIKPSYDEEKLIDQWKNNPKACYIRKELTLQNYIWWFLTDDMGLSDVCAAGIFGNMMVECGSRSFNLQPYIYSPGGAYYGLCQWSTTNHHSGIRGGTLEQQLEYLRDSIESEMGSSSYRQFRSSDTAEAASIMFAQYYERCADPYGRQDCAGRAYERFTSN